MGDILDFAALRDFIASQPFDKDLLKYKRLINPINKLSFQKQAGSFHHYIIDWQTGKYEYISKGLKKLLGYEETRYQKGLEALFEIMHPDDSKAFQMMVNKWMELLLGKSEEEFNNYSGNFNFRIRKKDGEYINVLQQPLYVSLDKKRNIVFETGMLMDISRYENQGEMSLMIYGPDKEKIIEYFPKREQKVRKKLPSEISQLMDKLNHSMGDPFSRELRSTISYHLHDEKFSVEKASQILGLSRSQFFRKVKKQFNLTPTRIILFFRMQKAAQLIAQQQITISEVAFHTGFGSHAYFTKRFTEIMGDPPKKFLKKSLEEGR